MSKLVLVAVTGLVLAGLASPALAEDVVRVGGCGTLYVAPFESSEVCNPLLEPLGGTSVGTP